MPRREDDAGLLRDPPYGGAEANGDVVVDGHGGDIGDRQGGAKLVGADVGETDVADETVLTHAREGLDDFLEGGVGHRRRVQVVEVCPHWAKLTWIECISVFRSSSNDRFECVSAVTLLK